MEVCALYEKDHPMNLFPSLLGLKEVLKGETHEIEKSYFITPKKPWQAYPLGMN